jgi:hypothetical protein
MTDLKKLQEQIDALQSQNEILLRAVDQQRLQRFTPKDRVGKTCKVSTYKTDLMDEPRLVIAWKMLKDEVRTYKGEIFEDQLIELTLDGEDNQGQINTLRAHLANTKDPEKIKEKEQEIERLYEQNHVVLKYKDFGMTALDKVRVDIIRTGLINGVEQVVFNYNDKEYSLPLCFIN